MSCIRNTAAPEPSQSPVNSTPAANRGNETMLAATSPLPRVRRAGALASAARGAWRRGPRYTVDRIVGGMWLVALASLAMPQAPNAQCTMQVRVTNEVTVREIF
eukprot:scaffold5918_cov124-Isochrysis_galbana.AAC.13